MVDRSSLPFMPECGLLIVLASRCRAPALGKGASVAAAHLVSSWCLIVLSCPVVSGIFLDQESQLRPLHWQAGSTTRPPETPPWKCLAVYCLLQSLFEPSGSLGTLWSHSGQPAWGSRAQRWARRRPGIPVAHPGIWARPTDGRAGWRVPPDSLFYTVPSLYRSGPQPLWQQGPVLWKRIFPQTR